MRKKKFNALLASLLVFSMAFSQPAAVLAEENTTVSENEDNDSTVTEEENNMPETGDEESGQNSSEDEKQTGNENLEDSLIPEEWGEQTETEENDQTTEEEEEQGRNENGEDVQTSEKEEGEQTETGNEDLEDSQITDEEDDSQIEDEDSQDSKLTDEASIRIEAQSNGISVENQKKLNALGFKAMALDQSMRSEKGMLSQVLKTMSSMESGKDYLEGEVVYYADSEKDAKKIAECYGGTVSEYNYGIAVADIEQSVLDAVTVAADISIPIPAVYPNIVYTIAGEWDTSTIDKSEVTIEKISDDSKTDSVRSEMNDAAKNQTYAQSVSDPDYSKQWYHETIHTLSAWGDSDASKGAGVTVAVLDTGIDDTHPDLDGNIAEITSVIAGLDGRDGNGHGTHCAGIIAAEANDIGGVGIAPMAKIYSVQVMDADGVGTTATSTAGIEAALAKNVDVISMSLGSQYYDALSQKAIDKAVKKGIVVVAAAGNGYLYADGYNYGSTQKTYPAAYNNVISVAATDQSNWLTDFSNYGDWVDIAAPGSNIYSTIPTYKALKTRDKDGNIVEPTDYYALDGTSMACPIVAGTVALMLANNESLRNTDTSACITRVTKELIASADADGAKSTWYVYKNIYYNEADDDLYYPLIDVEQAVYAVDDTALAVPDITFSIAPDSKNNIKAVYDTDFTFTLKSASEHDKIYYTINGKKPTAATGYLYTEPVDLDGYYGKTKIQAIAVRGSKSSKVFSKTYKINYTIAGLYPAGVDLLDTEDVPTAAMNVAVGKSIQLSVDIEPSYAANTKLSWSCEDSGGLIKVNKSGKVTCNKNAKPGHTAVVTAQTQDGSNKKCQFKITAVSAMVESLELNATELNMSYWADEEGTTINGTNYLKRFSLKATSKGSDNTQYLYKSSNTNVAAVDGYGNIRALSKGKAKITVTANDGSGKNAVCNVTVVTPVFDIAYQSSTGYYGYTNESSPTVIPIATGCSISMKTWVNYSDIKYTGFYKKLITPSNKSLAWTSSNESMLTAKNGKITCAKNATPGAMIDVKISAQVGMEEAVTVTFLVIDKVEKIYIESGSNQVTGLVWNTAKVGSITGDPMYGTAVGSSNTPVRLKIKTASGMTYDLYKYLSDYYAYDLVSVNISNRDVVQNTFLYSPPINGYYLVATKPGSTKVNYVLNDGSKKKFTISVKVSK